MLRRALISAALAGLLAAPAGAQGSRELLMPGVTYERQVQFTTHGPVAVHVIAAPKPGGLYSLKPVLSNGAIVGRERVTRMQRSLSSSASVAGVNGDLFTWADGRPSGMLMQSGSLVHPPLAERSALGISAEGQLRVERVRFFGTWRGSGQRRPMDLNESPGANGVSLFTSAWGPVTPDAPGTVEATLFPFPTAVPNLDLPAPVVSVKQGGSTPIPPGGAVLVARGTGAQHVLAEAPVGSSVTTRLLLSPDWGGIVDAIGGGPVLVRDGKPVFRHFELFTTSQVARNPRTAVGQRADGSVVFVVVDGRQRGYSVGMTNFELAQTLVRLGAVTGMGLDAGGSSTMAFEGRLLNRPSDAGGERAVSEGLFVLYEGVFTPQPSEVVVSPNGDGVAETQELAYKVVRPSRVTVTLTGPGDVVRVVEQDAEKAPGMHRFTWTGTTPEGAPEGEGLWTLTVTAVDDQGRTSTAQRVFALNRTLADVAVVPRLYRVGRGGRLSGQFTLTRPARVTATVRTRTGAIVATIARRELGPGPHRVVWAGRTGRKLAHSGRYLLRVRAVNDVGKMELSEDFTVRRVAAKKRR